MSVVMQMWTVYERPSDFPDDYVARRWDIVRGAREPIASGVLFAAKTLEQLRELLPEGLHRMPRQEGDEPQIVEVWL